METNKFDEELFLIDIFGNITAQYLYNQATKEDEFRDEVIKNLSIINRKLDYIMEKIDDKED